MTLYSYIVTHDTGFAPNPFFGFCTLACCKPSIRRTARKGDWIVGLAPKADGNRVVFYMRIDEDPIGFDSFWRDERFEMKKPRCDSGRAGRLGDNAYQPIGDGGFRQHRCRHSDGEREDATKKRHDLYGKNVLVSRTFAYFGHSPRLMPSNLKCLVVGKGHRSHFADEEKETFLRFADRIPLGVYSRPRLWPSDDDSWKKAAGRWLRKRNR